MCALALHTEPASGNVLENDTDPESDTLGAALVSYPTVEGAVVDLQPGGYFIYTPAPGYVGLDTFTYYAYDWQFYSMLLRLGLFETLVPELRNEGCVTPAG